MLVLAISALDNFRPNLLTFSRILSKITIVLFMEYPIIVSTAATKELFICVLKRAATATITSTSCIKAITAVTPDFNSNLNQMYMSIQIHAIIVDFKAFKVKSFHTVGPTVSTLNFSSAKLYFFFRAAISFFCTSS